MRKFLACLLVIMLLLLSAEAVVAEVLEPDGNGNWGTGNVGTGNYGHNNIGNGNVGNNNIGDNNKTDKPIISKEDENGNVTIDWDGDGDTEDTAKDENGNAILDDDGNPVLKKAAVEGQANHNLGNNNQGSYNTGDNNIGDNNGSRKINVGDYQGTVYVQVDENSDPVLNGENVILLGQEADGALVVVGEIEVTNKSDNNQGDNNLGDNNIGNNNEGDYNYGYFNKGNGNGRDENREINVDKTKTNRIPISIDKENNKVIETATGDIIGDVDDFVITKDNVDDFDNAIILAQTLTLIMKGAYKNIGDGNLGMYNDGHNNSGEHNIGNYNSGFKNKGNNNAGNSNYSNDTIGGQYGLGTSDGKPSMLLPFRQRDINGPAIEAEVLAVIKEYGARGNTQQLALPGHAAQLPEPVPSMPTPIVPVDEGAATPLGALAIEEEIPLGAPTTESGDDQIPLGAPMTGDAPSILGWLCLASAGFIGVGIKKFRK